jgi:hypothetical protein
MLCIGLRTLRIGNYWAATESEAGLSEGTIVYVCSFELFAEWVFDSFGDFLFMAVTTG